MMKNISFIAVGLLLSVSASLLHGSVEPSGRKRRREESSNMQQVTVKLTFGAGNLAGVEFQQSEPSEEELIVSSLRDALKTQTDRYWMLTKCYKDSSVVEDQSVGDACADYMNQQKDAIFFIMESHPVFYDDILQKLPAKIDEIYGVIVSMEKDLQRRGLLHV